MQGDSGRLQRIETTLGDMRETMAQLAAGQNIIGHIGRQLLGGGGQAGKRQEKAAQGQFYPRGNARGQAQ